MLLAESAAKLSASDDAMMKYGHGRHLPKIRLRFRLLADISGD